MGGHWVSFRERAEVWSPFSATVSRVGLIDRKIRGCQEQRGRNLVDEAQMWEEGSVVDWRWDGPVGG